MKIIITAAILFISSSVQATSIDYIESSISCHTKENIAGDGIGIIEDDYSHTHYLQVNEHYLNYFSEDLYIDSSVSVMDRGYSIQTKIHDYENILIGYYDYLERPEEYGKEDLEFYINDNKSFFNTKFTLTEYYTMTFKFRYADMLPETNSIFLRLTKDNENFLDPVTSIYYSGAPEFGTDGIDILRILLY